MSNKSQSIQDYKIFLSMLDKYEELNLANYVEGDESKMVFGNTQNTEHSADTTKESVSKLCENLKNPFFNMYHWVKGEIFDIEAVNRAIGTKDKIQANINKNEKKKRSTQENLDNVTTGRKTVKTIFKNQDDTGKMVNSIENVSTTQIPDLFYSDRQGNRSADSSVRPDHHLSRRKNCARVQGQEDSYLLQDYIAVQCHAD